MLWTAPVNYAFPTRSSASRTSSMLSAFILSAAHTHAAKEYGMSPPLPRDLGRGILGCFLEDERQTRPARADGAHAASIFSSHSAR